MRVLSSDSSTGESAIWDFEVYSASREDAKLVGMTHYFLLLERAGMEVKWDNLKYRRPESP